MIMPFVFIFVFLISYSCFAYLPGASTFSLGGGGRSSIHTSDSHIINPSSLAHLDGGTFNLSRTQENSLHTQGAHLNTWAIHLSENTPQTESPSGLSYAQTQGEIPTNVSASEESTLFNFTSRDVWFSLGNFAMQRLAVGITYHYADFNFDAQTPSNKVLAPLKSFDPYLVKTALLDGSVKHDNNLNIGLIYTPSPFLGLSLTAHDILTTPVNDKTELGLGLLYLYEKILKFHFDYANNYTPSGMELMRFKNSRLASVGVENNMTQWVSWKLGVFENLVNFNDLSSRLSRGYGVSFAFLSPRFHLHLAYKEELVPEITRGQSVDLLIPF